ncbi:MAG: hypothetical protein ACMXYC_04610 [Candidatus Woesearchaeota archaeon]
MKKAGLELETIAKAVIILVVIIVVIVIFYQQMSKSSSGISDTTTNTKLEECMGNLADCNPFEQSSIGWLLPFLLIRRKNEES